MDLFSGLSSEHASMAVQVLKIIWINILLSGDNAIVIALACAELPPKQRQMGVIIGSAIAVVLLIIFTIFVAQLLGIPGLQVIGGLALLWIAVKLLMGEDGEGDVQKGSTLYEAVKIIVIADIVMSLDNVVAIAAAAGGQMWLITLGLLISIPIVVFGATLIMTVLQRFPILVWAGAALLGWVAGELITSEVLLKPYLDALADAPVIQQLGHVFGPVSDVIAGIENTVAAIMEKTMGWKSSEEAKIVLTAHQHGEHVVETIFKVVGAGIVLLLGAFFKLRSHGHHAAEKA